MTNIRRRHTPEQVVRKLGRADRLLADGADIAAVRRELGVSEQTYYRWRNQYGGLKADDARRLKELEKQNGTLKRLLAEAEEQGLLAAGKRSTRSISPQPAVLEFVRYYAERVPDRTATAARPRKTPRRLTRLRTESGSSHLGV